MITPDLIVALATLITAITALVKVFQVHDTAKDTNQKVEVVKEQTNGTLNAMRVDMHNLQQAAAAAAPHTDPPAPAA